MAKNPRRTSSRRNRTGTKVRLRLRVELLESRTVLSAIGPATPGLAAGPPPADMLSRLRDVVTPMIDSALPTAGSGAVVDVFASMVGVPRPRSLTEPLGGPALGPNRGDTDRLLREVQTEGGIVDLAIASSTRNPETLDGLPSGIEFLRAARVSFDTLGSGVPYGVPLFRAEQLDGFRFAKEQVGLGVPVVDLSHEPPPAGMLMEGGLIDLGVVSAVRRRQAEGQMPTMAQSPAATRPSASQATANLVTDFASRDNDRPNPTVIEVGVAAVSPVNPSDASKDAVAVNGGGPIVSPGGASSLVTEWDVGFAGQTTASPIVAMEGGFIELAPDASSSLAKGAEAAPSGQSVGDSEKRDAEETGWKGLRREEESLDATQIAEEDPAQAAGQSVAVDGPEVAAQASTRPSESMEGGMIELAATGLPSSGSTRDSRSSPSEGTPGNVPGGEVVPMDHGVALFQAFELATAPAQQGDRPSSAWVEASQSGLPLEMSLPPQGDEPLSADKSTPPGDGPEAESPQRAGVLQVVAIASSLVVIDKARREAEMAERQRGSRTDDLRSR